MQRKFNANARVVESKPPPYQRVYVCGPNFRCLGYIDEKGTWRDWRDKRELSNVTNWDFAFS